MHIQGQFVAQKKLFWKFSCFLSNSPWKTDKDSEPGNFFVKVLYFWEVLLSYSDAIMVDIRGTNMDKYFDGLGMGIVTEPSDTMKNEMVALKAENLRNTVAPSTSL